MESKYWLLIHNQDVYCECNGHTHLQWLLHWQKTGKFDSDDYCTNEESRGLMATTSKELRYKSRPQFSKTITKINHIWLRWSIEIIDHNGDCINMWSHISIMMVSHLYKWPTVSLQGYSHQNEMSTQNQMWWFTIHTSIDTFSTQSVFIVMKYRITKFRELLISNLQWWLHVLMVDHNQHHKKEHNHLVDDYKNYFCECNNGHNCNPNKR